MEDENEGDENEEEENNRSPTAASSNADDEKKNSQPVRMPSNHLNPIGLSSQKNRGSINFAGLVSVLLYDDQTIVDRYAKKGGKIKIKPKRVSFQSGVATVENKAAENSAALGGEANPLRMPVNELDLNAQSSPTRPANQIDPVQPPSSLSLADGSSFPHLHDSSLDDAFLPPALVSPRSLLMSKRRKSIQQILEF